MRRLKVVALLMGVLVASAAFTGIAVAFTRASSKTSARIQPPHINPTSIKTAKYTWTGTGKMTYGKFCPNGQSVFPYCSNLPKSKGCTGKIKWTAQMGTNPLLAASGKKIGSGSTKLSSNCTYSFKHHFKTSLFIAKQALTNSSKNRHVKVIFSISFGGNTYVSPSNARTQRVVAKVLEPGH